MGPSKSVYRRWAYQNPARLVDAVSELETENARLRTRIAALEDTNEGYHLAWKAAMQALADATNDGKPVPQPDYEQGS